MQDLCKDSKIPKIISDTLNKFILTLVNTNEYIIVVGGQKKHTI